MKFKDLKVGDKFYYAVVGRDNCWLWEKIAVDRASNYAGPPNNPGERDKSYAEFKPEDGEFVLEYRAPEVQTKPQKNELRTVSHDTVKFRDIRPGGLLRFIGQDDPQEVWIKTNCVKFPHAVSLSGGHGTSSGEDAACYLIKECRILPPGSA